MFEVRKIETGEILKVYGVSKDGQWAYFLLSPPNHGGWYWDDADHYELI